MKSRIVGWSLVAGMLILGISTTVQGEKPVNQRTASTGVQTQSKEIPNSQIDPRAFLASTQAALDLREGRRISEDEFIRLSRQKGVVVLDARSKDRYDQIHIKGAISFPFTDLTFDSLQKRLPDKSVKILIYCNNNFRGNVPEFQFKSVGAALNLSTFSSLYEYGYRNVYELGPALELNKTKLELVGPSSTKYVSR